MHPEPDLAALAHVDRGIPRLRPRGSATQLVVGGAPFLILGGELGNSTASSPESLSAVWPRMVAMGLNTVLLPVYWELVEPEEGLFDFTLLSAALAGARAHGLRLILLWFGSWKNSMSTYAPSWVKTQRNRFPFVERADGRRMEILTPFSEENVRADARAFAAVMRRLAQVDAEDRTVILVQVENEVGLLEEAADCSPAARAAFDQPVPTALLAKGAIGPEGTAGTELPERTARTERTAGTERPERTAETETTAGTWRDVFGERAEEAFMAYYFARYVDRVASAGKAEHPLPMFVNAALNCPGRVPGEYPSGGPLPQVFDVWRAGAPAIDFLAPDIYLPDFRAWCEAYRRSQRPLFIPEIANGRAAAAQVFCAFGRYDAIGFSPFAIDTMADAAAAALTDSYGLLRELAPHVLENQGTGRMGGAVLDSDTPTSEVRLGTVVLTLRHDYTFEWSGPARETLPWPPSGALVVATGPHEYLVAGNGVIVTFADEQHSRSLGLLQVDEGRLVGTRFETSRRLNGDETHQGRHVRIPFGRCRLQRVRLYDY